MNKLANLVKETRKEIWKDDNAQKLVDIFEEQAEIKFAEFFRSKPLLAISCRVFGIAVKNIENNTFTFGEILYDVDTYNTDAEAEKCFIDCVGGYENLSELKGTFNWHASIKGLRPFIEELKSRGYNVHARR